MGFLPQHIFQKAKKPLNNVTKNGGRLEGGAHTVVLGLQFEHWTEEGVRGNTKRLDGEFYSADIHVDAIISFPWLVKNRLGVFPHLRALVDLGPPSAICMVYQQRGTPRGVNDLTKSGKKK